MHRTYKFRLYPTKAEQHNIHFALERCRLLYNRLLAERIVAYQQTGLYEKVANQRKDYAHKESRKLINEYGFIAFEDLNIQGMVKNHHLAKSIVDAGWNQLVQFVTYKAESAGRQIVLVNPSGTSLRCSSCGENVKKSLAVRIHRCPCGYTADRDENAAINILKQALQNVS